MSLESNSASTAYKCGCITLVVSFLLSAAYGWFLYLVAEYIGAVFTFDASVAYRIWQYEYGFPILHVCITVSECCKGILRAMHRQRQSSAFHLLCNYILGLGLAYFLAYLNNPKSLLLGFWVGVCCGWILLTLVMLLYVMILIDWEREVRRTQLRIRLKESGDYHAFCLPRVGSVSIGGYPFPKRDMYNNIDDLEEAEIVEDIDDELLDDDTVSLIENPASHHSK